MSTRQKRIISLICMLFLLSIIYAEDNDIFRIVGSGTKKEVEQAIENGADLNVIKNATVYIQKNGSEILSLKKESEKEYIKVSITVLMYAASNSQNPEIIKLLLEKGGDANLTSNDGKTAFDYAGENNFLKKTKVYWKLNDLRYKK